jgi:hypothetical protein
MAKSQCIGVVGGALTLLLFTWTCWRSRVLLQTQQQYKKNLQILNFLIIIKTSAQVINIFSKNRQSEKLFNLCQNRSCTVLYVYTLVVSHVRMMGLRRVSKLILNLNEVRCRKRRKENNTLKSIFALTITITKVRKNIWKIIFDSQHLFI